MNLTSVLALGPIIAWVVTEVVGKFLLPKLNKKVLSVLVGVIAALVAKFTGDMTLLETVIAGTAIGPLSGLLHDKLLEPVLILGKNELDKKE